MVKKNVKHVRNVRIREDEFNKPIYTTSKNPCNINPFKTEENVFEHTTVTFLEAVSW